MTRGPAALHCGRLAAAETNADALREQLNSRAFSAQKDDVARGAQQVTAPSEAQSWRDGGGVQSGARWPRRWPRRADGGVAQL